MGEQWTFNPLVAGSNPAVLMVILNVFIIILKFYGVLICLSCVILIIKECLLVDRFKIATYGQISKNGYIYNSKDEPYTFIAILYDLKRYVLNDFK